MGLLLLEGRRGDGGVLIPLGLELIRLGIGAMILRVQALASFIVTL